MIPRYEVKELSALWSDRARFTRMLEVELAILEEWEARGVAPLGCAAQFAGVLIRPERINEIEAVTRHDTIAFCSSITEQRPPEYSRYFHFGVTSSDVLDTALSLQIRDSVQLVLQDLRECHEAILKVADQTGSLLALGRSHGMAAEPIIFGQKFLSFAQEFSRRRADYDRFLAEDVTGQISGAVGNYTIVDPAFEAAVLKRLNLKVEPVSTQVIPRDRIAKLVSIGALLASAMERMAVEVRHLHRSEVSEVSEGFAAGQKGSSTMPHKKNPIATENVTGIARVLRSHLPIALENIVLWHERDISHSSTERLFLPDHFGLLSYALKRLSKMLAQLEVNRSRVESRAKESFAVFSSLVLHELIRANSVSREELYRLVQEASFASHSLEEFRNHLAASTKRQGLQFDSSIVDWSYLEERATQNFAAIRAR